MDTLSNFSKGTSTNNPINLKVSYNFLSFGFSHIFYVNDLSK